MAYINFYKQVYLSLGMKGILVVLDGAGDLPNKQLKGKTPLEAAEMPNLDFLATRGELGLMDSVKPGFVPQSDEAIVSIFGNKLTDSTRGQLEARGAGIDLTRGDLAFRVNFATVEDFEEGKIIDRRAGRTLTTEEAEILAKALNKIKLPCKFEFKATVQHRAVFVMKGGFSDNITGNDSTYSKGKGKEADRIGTFVPLDDEENSQYTVNIVKEFVDKAYDVLKNHPVNKQRKKKGLMPANFLLMRDPGIEKPKLKFYKRWFSVAYLPLEKGFSKTSGMKVFEFKYPKLKGIDVYKNLWDGLEKACKFSVKTLKKKHKKFDYAYIHIKETDLPGHDNKPLIKKKMLEHIDKTLFKFLRKFAPPNNIKVVVTADHSTPCNLKAHSADPVPLMFYNKSIPKKSKISVPTFLKKPKKSREDSVQKGVKFCETTAKKGSLGRLRGSELFEKIGFTR